MSLVDKKSMLDRNVLGVPDPTGNLTDANGNPVGQNAPSDGTYFTQMGTTSSPFDKPFEEGGGAGTKSPLLELARDKIVESENAKVGPFGGTGKYDPAILQQLAPKDPAFVDQDLDTLDPKKYLDNLT